MIIFCSCFEVGAHLARAEKVGHKFQHVPENPDTSMTGVGTKKSEDLSLTDGIRSSRELCRSG
jgi:hypothetical protein